MLETYQRKNGREIIILTRLYPTEYETDVALCDRSSIHYSADIKRWLHYRSFEYYQ